MPLALFVIHSVNSQYLQQLLRMSHHLKVASKVYTFQICARRERFARTSDDGDFQARLVIKPLKDGIQFAASLDSEAIELPRAVDCCQQDTCCRVRYAAILQRP